MMETCWEKKEKINRKNLWSIPVASNSKTLVCSRSLAGIEGSNPAGSRDARLVCEVLCLQVEVSATG